MWMALTAKNKLSFVDGSITRPIEENLLFGAWNHSSSMVISWILNSVTREIADSLLYIETAVDIWNDLHDRFHQSNGPWIFQIKKSLIALNQGSLDVKTNYTRLKILWDELKDYQTLPHCSCGSMRAWLEFQQREYVIQFLMGLNRSYSQTRGQILLMDPLPSISKVFSLVVQEERQWSINPGVSNFDSMPAHNFSPTAAASSVNLNSNSKKDRPLCSHCNILGHTIDKCYKLHGYPPGYKFKSKTQQPKAQVH